MASATTSRMTSSATAEFVQHPAPVTMYFPLVEEASEWAPPAGIAVQYVGELPAWLSPVIERSRALLALGKNWDSYGAHPVEPEVVVHSLRLLAQVMLPTSPAPFIVPTPLGGVTIEWHGGENIELELRVDPDQAPLASYCRDDDEREWFVESGSAISDFTKALRSLGNV